MVSAGKFVRDDADHPVTVNRYSDRLLVTLLRARNPRKYAVAVRPLLPGWFGCLVALFIIVAIAWIGIDIAQKIGGSRSP